MGEFIIPIFPDEETEETWGGGTHLIIAPFIPVPIWGMSWSSQSKVLPLLRWGRVHTSGQEEGGTCSLTLPSSVPSPVRTYLAGPPAWSGHRP